MPAERQKEPDGPTLASHQVAVILTNMPKMASLLEGLRGTREACLGLTTSPLKDLLTAASVLAHTCSSAWSPEQQAPLLREIQRLGQLLVEQDGQLQALLAARGPADEDAHWRVWVAIAALASTLLLTVRLSTVQTAAYKPAAAALRRATRVLYGSGRLALAAAVQRSSRLSADVRYRLLQSSLMAGNAAWQLTHAEASHEPLLNLAAASAFQPADTAAWLQLVTSGLLSVCMGGPLAATLGEGKVPNLLFCHATVCQLLLCRPELEAVSAAIAQHATLPQFIARLLITQSLPAAAEVLEFLVLHPQLLERMAAAAQDMVHHERELACLAGGSHTTMQYCCGSARAIATLLGTDIFSQTAAMCRLPSAHALSAFTVCEDQLKVLQSFVHEAESAAGSWDDSSLQSQLRLAVTALRRALPAPLQPPWELPTAAVSTALQQLSCVEDCVTKAQAVAALLRQHWDARASNPAVLAGARLELARAAATRNCANLRCPHFGRRGKKCTGCRAVHYCCQECNVAGRRAGHKHVCAVLAAERQ